jgi:hypothetical protein
MVLDQINFDMEKQILLELQRMKQIMGYDRNNPIDVIFEQDPKLDRYVDDVSGTSEILDKVSDESKPTMFGKSTVDRSTFFIGKDTQYPFFQYFDNDLYDKLEVSEGTQVVLFGKGETAKNFLPNVKVGTVIDDLGKEHTNQEYLELEMSVLEGLNKDENPFSLNNVKTSTGKQVTKLVKACLPSSDIAAEGKNFWGIHEGTVARFTTNVRSEGGMFKSVESKNVTFSVAMEPKQTTASDDGTQQLGLEAAVRCRGGDNGWGWVLTPPPIFFDVTTGQPYNPKDPQNMDVRSDWEVWYDHYGMWLEIGIGVAASFLGAGLATLILRVGRAAGAAGALWGALSSTYAGGTTTVLSVFMQVLTEGVMMAPIIKWQFENDKDPDAMLSTIFCLIPFVSETKAVSKIIGGRYSAEAANGVAEKITRFGLTSIFNAGENNPEAAKKFIDFLNSLTATELALFNRGMAIVSKQESMDAMLAGVTELIQTGGKFGKEMAEAKTEAAKKTVLGKLGGIVGPKTAELVGKASTGTWVGKNLNPLTARWVIPFQFARMGAPIAVFATAFKAAYQELTEEEKVVFDNNYQKSLKLDEEYFIELNKIDPYLMESCFNKQIEVITSDKSKLNEVMKTSGYLQTDEGRQLKDEVLVEALTERQNQMKATVAQSTVDLGQSLKMRATINSAARILFEKLKFTEINFISSKDINNITGTCFYENNSYNFNIRRENEKAVYYVGEKKITDDEIKNEKWDPSGAKTIPKEHFFRKKDIIRNIYR